MQKGRNTVRSVIKRWRVVSVDEFVRLYRYNLSIVRLTVEFLPFLHNPESKGDESYGRFLIAIKKIPESDDVIFF
jgi:hypothetical protein